MSTMLMKGENLLLVSSSPFSFFFLNCPPYLPLFPFFSLNRFVLPFLYFLLNHFLNTSLLCYLYRFLSSTFLLSLKPVAGRVKNTCGILVGELERQSPL